MSRPPNGKKYHVARLTAGAIRAVDVSIRPDPQEHDQGHCLLPEINIKDYSSSAERKDWIAARAAMLAEQSAIVLAAVD